MNVSPMSAPSDVQQKEVDQVDVFDQGTQPKRPYIKYAVLRTDEQDSVDAATELREQGAAKGCDGIVLSQSRESADCIIYKRGD